MKILLAIVQVLAAVIAVQSIAGSLIGSVVWALYNGVSFVVPAWPHLEWWQALIIGVALSLGFGATRTAVQEHEAHTLPDAVGDEPW